jgi:hypothetical protein
MGYWNHRVVREWIEVEKAGKEPQLRICEVHYNDDGKPYAYDRTPFLIGDTLAELKRTVRWMTECLGKPILNESEFHKEADRGSADQ